MRTGMKKSVLFLFAAMLLLALSVIIGLNANGLKPVTLTISAAQSLKDVMDEVALLYKEKYPDHNVVVNLGGSGSLQRQIEQGAPVDLFISAALDNMAQLKGKGLLYQDAYWNLIENRLVLVTPKDSSEIQGFEDLLLDKVQTVALGEPNSVPAGMYALEALSFLDMDGKVKEKSVYAKDVREVAAWVESGNAQAGFVYMTDALASKGLRVAVEADPKSHTPIVYPVGIIKDGQVKEALELVELLYSKEAAGIFEKYGFIPLAGDGYGF
jgi:molybdate transport system substrate-binding protein